MSSYTAAPVWTERPLFVNSGDETLFGILAEPVGDHRGVVVLHLRGGNQGPSSGRNRTSATLSRRLASSGFHTLRFDYHGVGESTGEVDHFRLDEPFKEDVEAWARWLRALGLHKMVLVGECFGARTAVACSELLGLEAVVLVAPPVRDAEKIGGITRPTVRHRSLLGYAMRALRPRTILEMIDPKQRRKYFQAAHGAWQAKPYERRRAAIDVRPSWVSSVFMQGLSAIVTRGLPMLLVNGTADPGYEDFVRAETGTLGRILSSSANPVSVKLLQGRIAACADASTQEPAIDLIAGWLESSLQSWGRSSITNPSGSPKIGSSS